MTPKLAVTGIGFASPLGSSPATLVRKLRLGASGIRRTKFQGRQDPVPVGRVAGSVTPVGPRRWPVGRCTALSLSAVKRAISSSSLPEGTDMSRVGIIQTTIHGNLRSLYEYRTEMYEFGIGKASPMQFPNTIMHASAGFSAMDIGAQAFNLTISNGMCSGFDALSRASLLIAAGACDYCICVASEDVSRELLTFIESDTELDSDFPDPFGSKRSGFALGEAAVALMVEDASVAKKRGIVVLAEILSHNSTRIGGASMSFEDILRLTLDDAKLKANEISAIAASANGGADDVHEAHAIHNVFGNSTLTTTLKATYGETGSAGPLLSLVSMLYCRREQMCPPSLGRSEYDRSLPPINLARNAQHLENGPMIVTAFDYRRASGAIAVSGMNVAGGR